MIANSKTEYNLIKFLEFFSQYRAWEIDSEFFEDIDRFFKDVFFSQSLLVLSYPLKEIVPDKKISDLSRIIWKRNDNDVKHIGSRMYTILNSYKAPEVSREKLLKYEGTEKSMEALNLYSLYLGDNERQRFVIIFSCSEQINCEDTLVVYFLKFIKNAFASIQKWKLVDQNSRLANIDDVTGLFNQRKLQKDLDLAIDRYNATGSGFAILFMDVDHFKEVNDGHGHLIGSRLLSDLAIILKKILRESDLVYRYGGDEFVMIVPSASVKEGKIIGDRLLAGIVNNVFKIHDHKEFKISVSIGIANYPDDAKTKEDVLTIADQMMYYAKARGRGRVCYAGDLVDKVKLGE